MADSEARASVFMNRRIRNRTSGGVGGRRGWKHPRLLPDGILRPGASLRVRVVGCRQAFWITRALPPDLPRRREGEFGPGRVGACRGARGHSAQATQPKPFRTLDWRTWFF